MAGPQGADRSRRSRPRRGKPYARPPSAETAAVEDQPAIAPPMMDQPPVDPMAAPPVVPGASAFDWGASADDSIQQLQEGLAALSGGPGPETLPNNPLDALPTGTTDMLSEMDLARAFDKSLGPNVDYQRVGPGGGYAYTRSQPHAPGLPMFPDNDAVGDQIAQRMGGSERLDVVQPTAEEIGRADWNAAERSMDDEEQLKRAAAFNADPANIAKQEAYAQRRADAQPQYAPMEERQAAVQSRAEAEGDQRAGRLGTRPPSELAMRGVGRGASYLQDQLGGEGGSESDLVNLMIGGGEYAGAMRGVESNEGIARDRLEAEDRWRTMEDERERMRIGQTDPLGPYTAGGGELPISLMPGIDQEAAGAEEVQLEQRAGTLGPASRKRLQEIIDNDEQDSGLFDWAGWWGAPSEDDFVAFAVSQGFSDANAKQFFREYNQ